MRLLSVASLGLFSLVHLAVSQDLSTLPSCAVSCALNAIGATGCAVTDAKCICSATSFLSTVQTCISTACNATDQQATLAFAQQFCLSGGVTITLPTGSAPAPPVSTATASGTATVPGPQTVSATTTITSLSPAGSGSGSAPPPAATYTGAANVLQQKWGVLGLLGLGVAAAI